jgi:hypothetical protein
MVIDVRSFGGWLIRDNNYCPPVNAGVGGRRWFRATLAADVPAYRGLATVPV